MTDLGYRLFDADEHYYEPDDCFTRHIEAAYPRPHGVGGAEGARTGAHVGRRRALPLLQRRSRRQRRPAGRHEGVPARRRATRAGVRASRRSTGSRCRSSSTAARGSRRWTQQGVEACLMLPTAGVGVEPQLREPRHREVLYPSLRAFNRWLEEDWGLRRGRPHLRRAALVRCVDLDEALERARPAASRGGARFVVLTAGPIDGRVARRSVLRSVLGARAGGRRIVVYHIGRTPVRRDVQRARGACGRTRPRIGTR